MHTPKIGDKFKLGEWEWTVDEVSVGGSFRAMRDSLGHFSSHWFYIEDTDKLSWINPKPTCSKAFAEEMKTWFGDGFKVPSAGAIFKFLDSHIESET